MKKLGFIGMGNMASTIACGLVKSKFISGQDINAYDIQQVQLDKVKEFGIVALESAIDVVKESDIIFMAVKPQVLESVLSPLVDALKEKAIVSIVLGYDFDKYNTLLDKSTRHISVMPNTPVLVLKGMSLIESKHSLTKEEFEWVKSMFSSIGAVEVVASHLMGVGGALSGCGPAYIYMIIEALADGAVKEGLPREMAYKLASQTVLGAGTMQLETGIHPGILKDNVCSPGGSTIQGVNALEEGNLRSTIIDAISSSLHYK